MSVLVIAAYLAYLVFVSLIFLVIYSKFGDFRRATTVALIVAKLWLAVYSILRIDVPLWVLYSKKTHAVIAEISFNEAQIATLLLANLWLNRDTISKVLSGRGP